ncbi:MAG: PilZ domain-containing protein [Bacteriovoracaceae bacterium]|nr:PilZ domain-containing protein [Bacteriovoracaceae bacterium]
MRYWKTFQKPLIHELLQKAKANKCPFILWQQYGSTRKVYEVELRELEQAKIKFAINKNSLKKMGELTKDKPIYFHIKDMDIIFKKDQYNNYVSNLESTPPNELQIYEKRRSQRFYYKYQDHKNITFESTTKKNETEPEFTLSCVLVDISTSGASMVVTKENKDRLATNMMLHLVNLTDQKLPEPFKTKVVYIDRYKGAPDEVLYKVGLQFADELDAVSYKSINSIIEKKATKVQGLDRDRFCGLNLEEQYKVLHKIEQTNRALANNLRDSIDYLDRLRYMTTKMKVEFLQSISHDLLATALRLSSKELIYDLFVELSANVREDFLEKLGSEKPPSAINKAQDEVIAYLRKKEGTGEFILDPNAFETYV